MEKKKIIKEDGRYLIFYSFQDETEESRGRSVPHEVGSSVEGQTRWKDEEKTCSLDTEGHCSG